MRKLPLLILLSLLLISCNPNINKDLKIHAVDQYNNIERNPFLTAVGISDSSRNGDFSFLLVSDTHIGKEDGIRVDEEFATWLNKNGQDLNLSFIVSLGDITDHSLPSEFTAFKEESLVKWKDSANTEIFIPLLGNHDNRIDGPALFKDSFSLESTYYRFDYGDVEFYILDSSFRTLGSRQLAFFKEAMSRSDKNKPKIILSHMPMHGNDTVIYGAMTDSIEIRSIVQSMKEGGARVFLSGHQHAGELTHQYEAVKPSESINELIASCFFGGTLRNFIPRFYICHYRSGERLLSIDVYSYNGNEFVKEAGKYSFPL